jgi:hypothetical protein
MPLSNEDIYLLGYNIKDVPISEIIWLNKKSHLVFDVKIQDNPLPYAAVVDIDFFTDISDETFEKETSKSFASILIKNNSVSLSYNDFKLNAPRFFNLIDIDKEWHRFEITISRENLWCPNKKCEFEDCLHLNAELIDNDLIKWTDDKMQKHRVVRIEIDGSKIFYFNYLSGANNLMISFGNNNINAMKDTETHLKALEANSRGESSIIIKNVSAFSDNDEIDFNMVNKF